jgi:Stage II sporulation protein E (SpoIIE)
LVTVAPPLPRSHLVPALSVTAVLCVALACPTVAKGPEPKGPHGHSHGAGKHGLAKGHAKQAARGKVRGNSGAAHAKTQLKAKPAPRGHANGATTTTQSSSTATGAVAASASGTTTSSGTTSRSGARVSVASASVLRAAARAHRARARKQRAARRAAAAAGALTAGAATASIDNVPAATTGDSPSDGSRASGERKKPRADRERPRFTPVAPQTELPQPLGVVRDIVEVVPTPLRVLVAGLVALSVLLALASVMTLVRNRRLAGQRRELLGQVGLLQAALLPELPGQLGASRATVAYRPADGLGAGGDFYDVLPLGGGRTAILIGDVSGHGRAALGRTALARYTLRAYIEAGLEPREALQVAGSVLAGKLEGDFVTALLAVHDAGAGTLTYATAGHPPPIVVSDSAAFEPVLEGAAPPVGVGASTGQRQTTLPFPRGAVACFYTDGLSEARTDGGQLGSAGLERIVRELGPDVTAQQVIDRVTELAGTLSDDAAACVVTAEEGAAIVRARVERLEISRSELRGPLLAGFLEACGVSVHGIRVAEREALDVARRMGGALVDVTIGDRAQVDVLAPDLPVREDATASLRQPSAPGR